MEAGSEATAWVLAITGLITAVGSLILSRRSQKEQTAQQTAANAVARDKHRLEETQQALDAMEKMLERAIAEADRHRIRLEQVEDERDEQKMLHRKLLSAQESRCREYAAGLTEAVLVLRRVVVDEIAAEMAEDALDQPEHPHIEPEGEREADGHDDARGHGR